MSDSPDKLSRRAFLTQAPVRAAAAGIATKEVITTATAAIGTVILSACDGKSADLNEQIQKEARDPNNGCATKHLGQERSFQKRK